MIYYANCKLHKLFYCTIIIIIIIIIIIVLLFSAVKLLLSWCLVNSNVSPLLLLSSCCAVVLYLCIHLFVHVILIGHAPRSLRINKQNVIELSMFSGRNYLSSFHLTVLIFCMLPNLTYFIIFSFGCVLVCGLYFLLRPCVVL